MAQLSFLEFADSTAATAHGDNFWRVCGERFMTAADRATHTRAIVLLLLTLVLHATDAAASVLGEHFV